MRNSKDDEFKDRLKGANAGTTALVEALAEKHKHVMRSATQTELDIDKEGIDIIFTFKDGEQKTGQFKIRWELNFRLDEGKIVYFKHDFIFLIQTFKLGEGPQDGRDFGPLMKRNVQIYLNAYMEYLTLPGPGNWNPPRLWCVALMNANKMHGHVVDLLTQFTQVEKGWDYWTQSDIIKEWREKIEDAEVIFEVPGLGQVWMQKNAGENYPKFLAYISETLRSKVVRFTLEESQKIDSEIERIFNNH